MKEISLDIGNLTLLDCLTCGMPWAESRKAVFKAAPESCAAAVSNDGIFFEAQPVTDAEKGALKELLSLDVVFHDLDAYIGHHRAGIRSGDDRVDWFSGIKKTGGALDFYWADLREHKLKMLFQRQFRTPYHPEDYLIDQVAEMQRYYSRLYHTFRRMKFIRWVKISVRQGLARIYVFNEGGQAAGKVQLIFERSFHRGDRSPACEMLDGNLWEAEKAHIRKRIDFWRLEETGALTDEDISAALHSEDEVLAGWALNYLRGAEDSAAVELIRKQISSKSAEEAKTAIRAAGRLWLNDLERDVMHQYNRRGNSIGPAVADFIGSLGMAGRPFLPKILRALTRRGDFATLISTIRALTAFPRSNEAAALSDIMSSILGIADDVGPILDRFPGIRTDLFGPQDPPVLLQRFSLETLRASAVHQIVESTAKATNGTTFLTLARELTIDSPFIEKLFSEIEINSRSEVSGYLEELITTAVSGAKRNPGTPVARRVVLAVRTLMRVTASDERPKKFLELLPILAALVDSYKRDSQLFFTIQIENFPSEHFINVKSILKDLPEEDMIIDALLRMKNLSEQEKHLIQEIARDA
jgi:hypothetical protein